MATALLLGAVVAVTLATPGQALAGTVTQTAQSGSISATFTFDQSGSSYSRLRLQIARSGQVLYDQPVTSRYCSRSCWPGGFRQTSVRLLALEAGAEPDVILALYTGGAHCCGVEQVFSYSSASAAYEMAEHDFGNLGAALKPLGPGGLFEFVSADNRFAYAFSCFACSGLPVQIFAFAHGHFSDVTHRHRPLVSEDAHRWWRVFTQHLSDGVGFIAAWAADEDLLGHRSLVNRILARELRRGDLRSSPPIPSLEGSEFIRRLQKRLRHWGYLR